MDLKRLVDCCPDSPWQSVFQIAGQPVVEVWLPRHVTKTLRVCLSETLPYKQLHKEFYILLGEVDKWS